MDGDKVMRLHGQTAKFENGLVLLPEWTPWLDEYIDELISSPNAKNDDQVDSTVYALAWMTLNKRWPGWTDESLAGLRRVVSGSGVHPLAHALGRLGLL